MSAPQEISDLVDRFAEHADAYRSGAYNETQLRREFVDPMFKALGWDMDNLSGYAEAWICFGTIVTFVVAILFRTGREHHAPA